MGLRFIQLALIRIQDDYERNLISVLPKGVSYFRKNLTFCPECIKMGYHSVYHQFIFFYNCPFHGIPLEHLCQSCGSEIAYKITNFSYYCSCGYCLLDLEYRFEKIIKTWKDSRFKIQNDSVLKWIKFNEQHKDDKKFFFTKEFLQKFHANVFNILINLISVDTNDTNNNNIYLDNTLIYSYHSTKKYINKLVTIFDSYNSDYKSIINYRYLNQRKQNKIYKERYSELLYIIRQSTKSTFKAIARYIKKSYLKKHKHCLYDLFSGGYLYKSNICPLAYSYFFWYKEILSIKGFEDIDIVKSREQMHWSYKGNKISISYLHNSLIELIFDKWRFAHKNFKLECSSGTVWIINKILSFLVLERFKEWVSHFNKLAPEAKARGMISLNSSPSDWRNNTNFILVFPRTNEEPIELHLWTTPNELIEFLKTDLCEKEPY